MLCFGFKTGLQIEEGVKDSENRFVSIFSLWVCAQCRKMYCDVLD